MKKQNKILLFVLLLAFATPLPSMVGVYSKPEQPETKKDIFFYVDSLCSIYQVPTELVIEIGQNESGWKNPEQLDYIRMCQASNEDSRGDIQVNMKYWNYYKEKYDIQGYNRLYLLETGIAILRDNYDRFGSWRKARFVYGRGHWRGHHTWTRMEKHFMYRINWYKYD